MNKLISKFLRFICITATGLALFVIMLGAYTRLTDAGLGCPDWPGCYGQLVVPTHSLEPVKAWTEMLHRYVAGTLGLLIITLAVGVGYARKKHVDLPWKIPAVLLCLLAAQASLGMWTVTLKLLPIVVMGHLLGGFLIFSCLVYYSWQLLAPKLEFDKKYSTWMINLGLIIVFCQIALGGWVSSNYAGIACIGFPLCNGHWVPQLFLAKAFNFWPELGANYQGGILDNAIRVTIQFVHRLGSYVTVLYLLSVVTFVLTCSKVRIMRFLAWMILGCVSAQFILGIINVIYLLPLASAVLHNGMAAVLFGVLISMRYVMVNSKRAL